MVEEGSGHLYSVEMPYPKMGNEKSPIAVCMDWKSEMLPKQWRLGLQGDMNYFVFGLFTSVMFNYHGPVVAGQMGMSLQLVVAAQSIALF
jgi:hypothetical protein